MLLLQEAAMTKQPRRLNRKRLPKWTRSLTATEIRHLMESGGMTLRGLKRNLAGQAPDDCRECQTIGRTLGVLGE